jgi:Protein of unknown function (DUF3303)
MAKRLYRVVEHFKNGDAVPVYRRFRDGGRLSPAGLVCVSSWVDERFHRREQLMETEAPDLLDAWMANWCDLVDFEVHEVVTSQEAARRIAPSLERSALGHRKEKHRRRRLAAAEWLNYNSCTSRFPGSFPGIPCRRSPGPVPE